MVEQLDTKVNSDVSEYNPLLSPDGKTLYFSRKNHPGNIGGVKDQEDIWYSELDSNGKWSEAKNMGPMVNNAGPNFVNAIASTPDGNAVLVLNNKYLPNGKMLAGVSMTTQINGRWTPPCRSPLRMTITLMRRRITSRQYTEDPADVKVKEKTPRRSRPVCEFSEERQHTEGTD